MREVRLWRYIAAGTLAYVALGVLVWVVMRPSPGGVDREVRETRIEQKAAQERVREAWEGMRMVSIADDIDSHPEADSSTLTDSEMMTRIEHQSRAIARVLEPALRDNLRRMPPDQREALIETVAAHIALRHQHNGAGYPAFAAEDDAHRWITPDDEYAWEQHFRPWYEQTFERKPDTLTPLRDIFPAFAEQAHSRFNSRLVGLADEPEGMRAWAARGRTSAHAQTELSRLMPEDEASFWNAGSVVSAMPLRVPVRSFQEVDTERRGAWPRAKPVARVHVLAKTEAGHVIALNSDWYWDPRANAWANMSFTRRGLERTHPVGCWF